MPPQVANVLVTVEPGSGSTGADSSLRLSYAIEQELYSHDGDEPFRLAWLDSIVLRKQQTQGSVGLFQKKGSVVEPKPFVPGSYFKGMPRPAARKPAAAKPAARRFESESFIGLSHEKIECADLVSKMIVRRPKEHSVSTITLSFLEA